MSTKFNICVIGAGVSGLSTAIILLKAGHSVTIFAKETADKSPITSSTAAAFWYPFWVGREPDHSWYRPEWALDTYLELGSLLNDYGSDETGIVETDIVEYFPQEMGDEEINKVIRLMWWSNIPMINFREFNVPADSPLAQNPDPWHFLRGIRFRTFVINMRFYLSFLQAAISDKAMIVPRILDRLPGDLFQSFDFVINCAGLGSREIVPDGDIYPVEGLVVRVAAHPRVNEIMLVHTGPEFDERPLYVVPRGGPEADIIVGGTIGHYVEGNPRYFDWAEAPIDERTVAEQILERNAVIINDIDDCDRLGVVVGYRPRRKPEVRLGPDWRFPQLIHNYGHGGAGVTVSWGCAEQVAAWINRLSEIGCP